MGFEFVGVGSRGGGHSTTIILDNNPGGTTSRMFNTNTMGSVTLRNISFAGNGNGATTRGIYTLAAGGINVFDCAFSQLRYGIFSSATGAHSTRVFDSYFDSCVVAIRSSTGSQIVGNQIRESTTTASDEGAITVGGASTPNTETVVARNHINNSDGIGIYTSGNVHIHHNTVSISGDSGIYSNGRGGVIESNFINAAGVHGIEVAFSNFLTGGLIIGNYVYNSQQHGIWVDEPDWRIFDNWVFMAGLATNNTYDAIHIDHSRAQVMRNRIDATDDFATTGVTRYGINIAAGTASIVLGNVYGGTANYGTDAFNDAGTSTIINYPSVATYGDNFVS